MVLISVCPRILLSTGISIPCSIALVANVCLKKSKRLDLLRHTFATNCIELNVDYKTVSELLGHSSVSTTLDLYVHTKLSQKQRCINLLSNCIKNIEI